MGEKSIIEMPQPLGLYAADLMERAGEFLQAFERLTDDDDGVKHAAYFMLAHALELFLKSYLAANGVSKVSLQKKGLRHDLPAIYDRCEAAAMPGILNLRDFVYSLHEMNRHNDFRYPRGYILIVPSPPLCLEIMRQLKSTLEPIISQSAISAQLQWASENRHSKGRKIRWSD